MRDAWQGPLAYHLPLQQDLPNEFGNPRTNGLQVKVSVDFRAPDSRDHRTEPPPESINRSRN
jgi:hypothetical protein